MSINQAKVDHPRKISLLWHSMQPWVGVAALTGAGLLPCPECGAPMIFHFWPIAAVLALRNVIRAKKRELNPVPLESDQVERHSL